MFFARTAHTLLDQARVEHVYCEHPGGHSIRSATTGLGEFVKTMTSAKRDPFSRRIVAMTHRGWQGGQNKPPLKHNKWITINETAEGRIPFDRVVRTGPSPSWTEDRESFLQQGFKTIKVDVPCSRVEASYQDGNVFDVMTTNVKEFSLWLHPKMVDFSRPITVRLNGRTLTRSAKPSLLDALRSYHRYRDWGLVYHCELKLSANERAAETSG